MKKSTKLLGLSAAAALLISAPAMAQDIKIGFVADLTGPIAGFAPGMVDTGNIALKNINDQGGILAGQNLVSVVADTGCDGGAGELPVDVLGPGHAGIQLRRQSDRLLAAVPRLQERQGVHE